MNQTTRHNAHDLTLSFTDEEPPAAIEDDADRDERGVPNLFSGYLPR